MAYVNSGTAEYAVQNEITNRLIAEKIYGYSNQYAVAVNANQDRLLYSILNKAVSSIQKKDLDMINQKHTNYEEREFSLIRYMYDYSLHIIIFILVFFVVLSLNIILIYVLHKRTKEKQQLIEEKHRNEILADALTVAENAGEAKSQFLSRVSHEMRTPLNAIIGFMQLAKEGGDTKEMDTYLCNADIAAKQLLSVINDVLDMSSIESGKMKIAHSPFDFKQTIHAITNIYLPICQQKGLKYNTRILTPIDEWLIGDQLRLNQILMNLLSNAVKFTSSGQVDLKISQYEIKEQEIFIRIEVTDTGCGMSEEMQERLFKPFEQENATTAQKYGGSGLGLSIVKNLVCMMDGAISVKSKQNEGSTFTVDIPFSKYENSNMINLPNGIKSLHVLAVDDEENERKYISIILNRMGIWHSCVADGEEALEALSQAEDKNESFNICLIDWKMPHLNGVDTTKLIREKYGEDVIVIVVSAYEQNQANEIAKDAGANLFIAKPLFQSTLLDLFMNLTGGEIAKRKEEKRSYNFSGKRVLLAEDNAMNLMITERILKSFGVQGECAENGKLALDKFTNSEPGYYDVILMDIQMPKMNGYEAAKAIRNSSHIDAKSIPIIALTANAFNEDIARTLSSGMNAHVAKPIDPKILTAELEKAFIEKNVVL